MFPFHCSKIRGSIHFATIFDEEKFLKDFLNNCKSFWCRNLCLLGSSFKIRQNEKCMTYSMKVEFVNTVFKKIITCLEGPINESIRYGPIDHIFLGLYLKNLNDVY